MGNVTLANNDFHVETNDKHFEIFSLIWLDTNMSKSCNIEQKLRSIINYLKKFQDIKQCQQYIEERSQHDRLILIVNNQLGREIVPFIHQFRQVISIYVYCTDKRNNEQWISQFSKIKGIFIEFDELISQIKVNYIIQKKIEEPLTIKTFNKRNKSTTNMNDEFLFFQILIDCLLRIKLKQTDNDELLNHLRNEYKGNRNELDNIREFQEKYSTDKVLRWYTRQSFFSKILNAILHAQSIHMMFLLCTYMSDIHNQLQRYQSKRILKVYRSQLISKDELETLKQSVGQFVSINSFFSTTTNYQVALLFSNVEDNLERILFEIIADSNIVTTKPFADISRHSDFVDESEVLFMVGSIFRLESISCTVDRRWIIQMTLCGDNEDDLQEHLMQMREQFGNEEVDLRILGKILWKMGKLDLAEMYFQRFLKELPVNDPSCISLYKDLGELAIQRGDCEKNVQWQQKLLASMKENQFITMNPKTNRTNSSLENQIILSIEISKRIDRYLNSQWNGSYNYPNNANDKQYYWTTPIDRGGKPYYCPIGWQRFSIHVVNDAKEFDKHWGDWPIAYHGTLVENVFNILVSGLRVSTTGCFYEDGIPRVHLSPSIEYCAHPRFAQPWKEIDKNGRTIWYQLIFQCRVNPTSIGSIESETVLPVEAKSIVRIDPNFNNSELEWIILGERDVEFLKNGIICYGLMIRASNLNPKNLSSSAWWKYSYGADVYNNEGE